MRDQYTRTGDCFLLVYSVTDKVSFSEVEALYEFLKKVKNEDSIPAVSFTPFVSSVLALKQIKFVSIQ